MNLFFSSSSESLNECIPQKNAVKDYLNLCNEYYVFRKEFQEKEIKEEERDSQREYFTEREKE